MSAMYSSSSFIEDDSDRQMRARKVAQQKYKEDSSTTSVPDNEVSQNTQNTERNNSEGNENPGPAAYFPMMKAVYPSSPSYSMVARHRDVNYSSSSPNGVVERTPGPAYKLPEPSKYKPSAPHYSFGVRHTWRKALLHFEYED
ncbi:hypothetical protein I4U23_015441 [Adineta vaga]|nr:hypothetical protein I4U23_015441 [Adineta vaga]